MKNDWIFTKEEVYHTPSRLTGVKYKEELLIRRKACDFIEKTCKALDLPKLAQNSADTYFHRFFMRQSFTQYDKYIVAAACILLGSKVEESVRKIGHIAKEYWNIRRQLEKDALNNGQKPDYQVIGNKIVVMEGVVLHTIAYDLNIIHPYKFINEKVDRVLKLQELSDEETKQLSGKMKQVAWSFLNDSAYTCACLRAEPHVLAAAAVYLSGLYDQYIPEDLCTMEGSPWWQVLSTPFHTLQDAACLLLAAYTEPYIDTRILPSTLAKLVYSFHAPKTAESPNHPAALVEVSTAENATTVASPLDSAVCVTSPECGMSQGRSPLDPEYDAEYKMQSTTPTSMKSRKRILNTEETSRRTKLCR